MSDAATAKADPEPLVIGRYALFDALASGGMATVHLGRLLGEEGFSRTVAVKRLHSHYTTDQEFVTMFMDEARIVARIRHPNVVPMVDVIESSKGLFLVMEYVHGESFSKLLRTCRATKEHVPPKVVTTIMHGVLLGLHAAHETKGTSGELLDVVHRDVSPQNIIVGADGVARVLDFGVAKAAGRAQVTREGQIKGKLAYMAPEQIRGKVDRRADVFAAAVVLWEALAGRRLHDGAKDVEIVTRVVKGQFEKPSEVRPDLSAELDAIVMHGLEIDPTKRYQTAREMAIDLERKIGLANPSEVGEWVERLASEALRDRAERVAAMEKVSGTLVPAESVPPPVLEPMSDPTHLVGSEMVDLVSLHGDPGTSGSGAFGLAETGFSSAGTPLGTEMPAEMAPPRRDVAPLVAALSFLGALALVGAVLGGYSLYARRTTATTSTSAGPSATAIVSAPPPVEPTPSPEPTPAPTPSSPPSTSASFTSASPAADAAPSQPVGTQAPAPTYRPPPVPAPAPAPKKNCDPPYTVDEQGHRKYKLECMSGE